MQYVLIRTASSRTPTRSANCAYVATWPGAHPFPIFSQHTYSIAIEDGAFIGKIFSHTRDRGRIPELLNAFEERRKPRCQQINQVKMHSMDIIPLAFPMQAERDAAMRANEAAGRNVMDAGEAMWDHGRMVYVPALTLKRSLIL
ncbi:hypothetical protein B0H16DRAFT_1577969 [Mycena metata]|uniref:Uncharacterized protein n=1 Tax=Mycena metata TaxID=1033252 RepID=A0AAD7I4E2_9AGAR|nr:hypothetical protein B0H16DRAFT_1577969 [Mycena metata]